jgi:NAD(P)-dependent dehydrogenase (short-subunit alcohol dehydrogenase family)
MTMVAVVTGASRGAGKGIAVALGRTGATVYVTGRSRSADDSPYGGTIDETAALVTEAGGRGVPMAVDHGDDEAVAELFATVGREQEASSMSWSTTRPTPPWSAARSGPSR